MNAYLQTCRFKEIRDSFQSILEPRPYLFKDLSKFSMQDFIDTHSGELVSVLKTAHNVAKEHIVHCVLCSGKGFICEVCKADKPIYPFDLDEISQCQKCGQVFHLECSLEIENCPRCERRDAKDLNWLVNQRKIQQQSNVHSDGNAVTDSPASENEE